MDSIASISAAGAQPVTAPALKESDMKTLHSQAIQMEATFNTYMLDQIVKGLPGTTEGNKTDEFSGQVFGGIFKQAIATKMAEENGTKGIAQQMYQDLLKKHARSEAGKQGISLPANSLIALKAIPLPGTLTGIPSL